MESSTNQFGANGCITRIFHDAEGEWLEVQYACGRMMRRAPRCRTATIPSGLSATATIPSGPAMPHASNGGSNGHEHGHAHSNASPDDMTQSDIDQQIRNSWARGLASGGVLARAQIVDARARDARLRGRRATRPTFGHCVCATRTASSLQLSS